jgi:hypothetical protein
LSALHIIHSFHDLHNTLCITFYLVLLKSQDFVSESQDSDFSFASTLNKILFVASGKP